MRTLTILLAALAAAASASAQQAPAVLTLREGGLELRAVWESLTGTVYGFETKYPWLAKLAPAVERATWRAEDFAPLLSPGPVRVGDVWRIDVAAVLPFLRQLHPGATAEMHHDGGFGIGAPGGYGCLRAIDAEHAHVELRVHADFLLAGDGTGDASSWFTPASFRGRMVVDRKRGAVVAFELGVPDQTANVDINIGDEDGVSADIGRIPRMEVCGGAAEEPAAGADRIPLDEAEKRLEQAFYPFAEIDWLDLATARQRSVATGKPLHVIALFGSLTDESC